MNDIQWDQAAKYLAGECSPDERAAFDRWLAEDPDRQSLIDSLRPHFAKRPPALPAVDVDAAWTRLADRIRKDALTVETGGRAAPGRSGVRWKKWALAAASILVVASAASVAVVRNQTASGGREIATGAGERREVVLADGSRITIAPMSRLRIRNARTATLDGEAYFVITHDPARPFTVETATAVVQDLGTAFVVRSLPAEEATRVAVEEGVVSLAPAAGAGRGDAILLRAGEAGTLARGTGPERDDAAAWAGTMAWTRGEIVFDATPMRDVVLELDRWFGLTAILQDEALATRTLTARLSGKDATEALEAISRSLGAEYARTGDTVTFSR